MLIWKIKREFLELLGSGKRTFNIPVYQRNYDWQSEHCRRLFKDISKVHYFIVVTYINMHFENYLSV